MNIVGKGDIGSPAAGQVDIQGFRKASQGVADCKSSLCSELVQHEYNENTAGKRELKLESICASVRGSCISFLKSLRLILSCIFYISQQ